MNPEVFPSNMKDQIDLEVKFQQEDHTTPSLYSPVNFCEYLERVHFFKLHFVNRDHTTQFYNKIVQDKMF